MRKVECYANKAQLMNPLGQKFSAEAVRLDQLHLVDPSLLFSFVLSNPVICSCRKAWAILLDQPLVVEYELGLLEGQHSSLLASAMKTDCSAGHPFSFYRTDGITIWPII